MEPFFQVGVEIDQCNSCAGVWLDRDEWTDLTLSRGPEAVQLKVIELSSTEWPCPRCQACLEKGRHSVHQDFQIDLCPQCGGGFFDRGELARLLARDPS